MDIETRMQIVERELTSLRARTSRLRSALVVALAVSGALLLGAAAPDAVPEVVRARRFEVITGKDRAVVILSVGQEGEGIVATHDDEGHPLVTLRTGAQSDGAVITFNREGYQLTELGQAREGAGSLSVFDGKGVRIAAVTANREGDGELRAFNRRGHLLARLRGTDASGGALTLSNARGGDLVSLGLDAAGLSALRVSDGAGAPAVWLGAAPNEGGYVSAFSAGGTEVRATWPGKGPPDEAARGK